MSIIKINNNYISSSYKESEVKGKFEEELDKYLELISDEDIVFDIHLFLEYLVENNADFEILLEPDDENVDIDYSGEEFDEIIEEKLSDYQDDLDYWSEEPIEEFDDEEENN